MQALGFHDRRDAKIERIARQPIFRACTKSDLRSLAKVCDEVDASSGDILARQGWHGPWFFVVEEGTATIISDGQIRGVVGPGKYFGESALLGAPHPVTVKALSNMSLLVFGRRDSSVTMEAIPSLARRFFRLPRRRASEPRADNIVAIQFQQGIRRHRTRLRPFLVAVGAVALVAWLGSQYQPAGLAVVSPGPSVDISGDVIITPTPTEPLNGRYLAPTVRVERPNLWGFVTAALRTNREIIAIETSNSTAAVALRQQVLQFEQSRLFAAAAAARVNGLKADVGYSDEGIDIELPFQIEFRERGLRGPSAGLAYALLIADLLDPRDLAAGRTIGATGTIGPDGRIGPVTGLAQKVESAATTGVTLFIAPLAQAHDGLGLAIRVPGVSTLKEAIETLSLD